MKIRISVALLLFLISTSIISQNTSAYLKFNFNGTVKSANFQLVGNSFSFAKGINKQALVISSNTYFNNLTLKNLSLNGKSSFTVQFWIQTTSKNPTIFLSQKEFLNKGINSQKKPGWVLYSSGGTFAWSIGSGKRRLNYERENGHIMPINDGKWHQLTMSYNKERSEIRLYYDGYNKAIYKVSFDFNNSNPIVIGSKDNSFNYKTSILPEIKKGAEQLQLIVDAFNRLNVENVQENEFLSLIVDPKELYIRKLGLTATEAKKMQEKKSEILDDISTINRKLHTNPYTVYQNKELTKLKPISKIYSLKNGKVLINNYFAKKFTESEHLYPSNFLMDNLTFFKKELNAKEILDSYKEFKESQKKKIKKKLKKLTVAVWNIWHGGKHFTVDSDGWDSRKRIAEMFRENDVDVILMQETYSSGDYIAAELGYYFATTSDWDYRLQGSNISLISRYPITELDVLEKAEFMNIAAKISLSSTQKIYAMSNWYGMSSFPIVDAHHKTKFDNSDNIPVLFGGDFNAVPHTDGGNSIASKKMLENGFIDAYRNLHPNVAVFPGYTHQWGNRIDQLYYKGKSLQNISTKVLHAWNEGFPSDHFMILSTFELK
jgi:endonuclease/exonuclease/phosphatase family metal-dependent hydrolase